MISIATLRTSQLEELASALARGDRAGELVLAIKEFLTNTPVDGGADSDAISTNGAWLSSYAVWENLSPEELGIGLKGVRTDGISLFLERASKKFRDKVLKYARDKKPATRPVETGYSVASGDHIVGFEEIEFGKGITQFVLVRDGNIEALRGGSAVDLMSEVSIASLAAGTAEENLFFTVNRPSGKTKIFAPAKERAMRFVVKGSAGSEPPAHPPRPKAKGKSRASHSSK